MPGGVGRGRHLVASGRCRPRWATAFLHRTDGAGATRGGGRHGLAHAEPTRCRSRHPEGPGRSRQRPGDPDRHRRSGGRGTTPSRPATCGAHSPHTRAPFPCTSTPMSFSHLWIGNRHADPGSKKRSPEPPSNAAPEQPPEHGAGPEKGTIRRRGSKARTGPGA